MNQEQRLARIAELEKELQELREEEYAYRGFNREALLEECRELKRTKPMTEAVNHYRDAVGCGLKEAYDVVVRL